MILTKFLVFFPQKEKIEFEMVKQSGHFHDFSVSNHMNEHETVWNTKIFKIFWISNMEFIFLVKPN